MKMWFRLQRNMISSHLSRWFGCWLSFFLLAKLKLQPYGHCHPQWVKQDLGGQNKMGFILVLI